MAEADVPIYVSIEMRHSNLRDQVREEMKGVREEIESALSGINVDIGARLGKAVDVAAPRITESVAGAIAAGGEEGAAAVQEMLAGIQAEASMFSAQAAASRAQSISPDGDDSDESSAASIGRGPLLIGYLALRAARGSAEYADKEADISEMQEAAMDMPGRTESQKTKRAELAVKAAKEDVDENSGIIGMLRGLASGPGKGGITSGNFWLGTGFQDTLSETKSNAEIDLANAQRNEDIKKFGDTSQSIQDQDKLAGLKGPEREREEAQIRYTEGMKKLKDEYEDLGGNTNDMVKAEQALADARDKTVAATNRAEAIATQEAESRRTVAADILHNDPMKAERDAFEAKVSAERERLGASGASGERQKAFEDTTDIERQELQRKQSAEIDERNLDSNQRINQQYLRTKESQMRGQGDDFGASMVEEVNAGKQRVDTLRERAKVSKDAAEATKLLAEADAMEAANSAEATEHENEHNKALNLLHQEATNRASETSLRAQGLTGQASDKEFADNQQGAMQKLLAGPHTQQQVDDLRNNQLESTWARQKEQQDRGTQMQLQALEENAKATGNPADIKKAEYESLREGIIRDEKASKGTMNEGAQRDLDEAKIRAFMKKDSVHLEEGFSSTSSLWMNMNTQLAKGGIDPATQRMAKGDLSSLLGGGDLTSDLSQAGKDMSAAANAVTKALKGKDLVVIKR